MTAIIVVTHNSEKHIDKMMQCINEQRRPAKQLIIVDSGSKNPNYLDKFDATLIKEKGDIGFARGNNIGVEQVKESIQYILYLNPDAFLTKDFIEKAEMFMEQHPLCGAVTGTTLGYDIDRDTPTGRYDTTGIFQKWYGKWYDRAQGETYQSSKYSQIEGVKAICGAVMFCRKEALFSISKGKQVMDESFYMYKEDIDLSLRLRKKGWTLLFYPELLAYHCRGWNRNRKMMPYKFRLLSAKNELTIHRKEKDFIKIIYSFIKYSSVKLKIN